MKESRNQSDSCYLANGPVVVAYKKVQCGRDADEDYEKLVDLEDRFCWIVSPSYRPFVAITCTEGGGGVLIEYVGGILNLVLLLVY